MLARTLLFFSLCYPLLSFSQKDIDLTDLELPDIEIPSISDLSVLENSQTHKEYASSTEVTSESKGGIHEKLPKPSYPEGEKAQEEKISWKGVVLPSKTESYYLYFSAGYGNISYTGSIPTTNTPALNLDLLGIYWPKYGQNFMVGMVLGLNLNELAVEENTVIVTQPSLSLSTNYFFGQNIGSGLFARLDLGFASVATFEDQSDAYILNYELGATMLIGTGYAIPISAETRMLINLSYNKNISTFNNINNGSDLVILTAGVLF
jgi:hypothetical protein